MILRENNSVHANKFTYIFMGYVLLQKFVVLIRFVAISFSRNVISSNRRFAEMQFCRIVTWPNGRISETS